MTTRAGRPLAWRLSLWFVVVAVLAVALLSIVMQFITQADVRSLTDHQISTSRDAIVASAESAYSGMDRWVGADLSPTLALAEASGAHVTVRDAGGYLVATGGVPAGEVRGGSQRLPLVYHGAAVGSVTLGFGSSGLLGLDQQLQDRLTVARDLVAVAAVVLALILGAVVARRITAPLLRLTGAAKAMGKGDRDVRIGQVAAAAELQSLAAAFDEMADTLAREDQLRQALVADAAHELRTPVAVLQASSEAVLDGVRQPSVELVGSMHQEVLRLRSRVEDLGALVSAESAGFRLVRRPVDLSQVAEDAVAALSPRLEAAGLSVTTQTVPAFVLGDGARLFQVATNLLVNAAKFTPRGGSVAVRVHVEEDLAILEVTDTGVGIEPSELAHVFERFWRGRAAGDQDGSGIGLAIVAELAQAHQGRAEVESVPGHGSTFRVLIPRA